jgi:hypothetical protein
MENHYFFKNMMLFCFHFEQVYLLFSFIYIPSFIKDIHHKV